MLYPARSSAKRASGEDPASAGRILFAGTNIAGLEPFALSLKEAGLAADTCDNPRRFSHIASLCSGVFLSLDDGHISAEFLQMILRLRESGWNAKVIVLAETGAEALAVCAIRAKVADWVSPPFEPAMFLRLASAFSPSPNSPHERQGQPEFFLGSSQHAQSLRIQLQQLAAVECNVLITGETGTGKELAATALHQLSARSAAHFVCLNCAAIPEALLESELFGHERGAFTGAIGRSDGAFQAADRGVLFLDEVGDLSPIAQAKLLRAVETRTVSRIGNRRATPVNVRIVAATNQDLEEMVTKGNFRRDLFFRLNVGRVRIAPLRERVEDIPNLLHHYRRLANCEMRTNVDGFSPEAIARLLSYPWPGNVRELKNMVESVLVSHQHGTISTSHLPEQFVAFRSQTESGERADLICVLTESRWNKSEAAARLHWSRMKLYRKMAKYSIAPSPGRAASA